MKENILLNEKGNLQNNVEVDSIFLKYFLKALRITILSKVSNWHIWLVRGWHRFTCMEPHRAQALANLIGSDLCEVAADPPGVHLVSFVQGGSFLPVSARHTQFDYCLIRLRFASP